MAEKYDRTVFSLRLPSKLHKKVVDQATLFKKSVNQTITDILEAELGDEEVDEEALALRKLDETTKPFEEMEKKCDWQITGSGILMRFYKVSMPMQCLKQALKDFEEKGGVWSDGEEKVELDNKYDLIECLTKGEEYFKLKRKTKEGSISWVVISVEENVNINHVRYVQKKYIEGETPRKTEISCISIV